MTPTVLQLALGVLTVAIGAIGWFIVDRVRRIDLDVREAKARAYAALTRTEDINTSILAYINETREADHARLEAARDALREETKETTARLDARLVELDREVAALRAYRDADEAARDREN